METAVIERAFSQWKAMRVTRPLSLGLGKIFTTMPCTKKKGKLAAFCRVWGRVCSLSGDAEGLGSQASGSAENSESSLGKFMEQNCYVRSHIYGVED